MAGSKGYSSACMRRRPVNVAAAKPRRSGVVLLLVLIVVVMLTLAAYTFSDMMVTEREAALLTAERRAVGAVVESGAQYARIYLSQDYATRLSTGGHYDNITQFQGIVVTDDANPHFRTRFSILAPSQDGYGYFSSMRFGLENESARLNINALAANSKLGEDGQREALMALPGMTEEIADSILDWIDEDDEPREFGAETEYYGALDPPYDPKNGPLTTVEELLLVRGVDPTVLFGLDNNHNGVVDPHEMNNTDISMQSMQSSINVSSFGGELDRGWAAFLTLYSSERNVTADSLQRIDINGDDLEELHANLATVLDDDSATFLCAYRQNGSIDAQNNGNGGESGEEGEEEDEGEGGDGRESDEGESGGSGGSEVQGRQSAGSVSFDAGETSSGGNGSQQGGQQSGQGNSGNGENTDDPGEPVNGRTIDLTQPGGTKIENIYDIIGQRVQVQFEGDPQPTTLASPFPNDETLPDYILNLLDNVTTSAEDTIASRININEAPRAVLMTIPGIEEEVVDQIIASRDSTGEGAQGTQSHESWILQDGIVDLDTMKKLARYITTRGDVYRAQIVGFHDAGGMFARAEVVIDATEPLPRVLFWRDLGQFGRGFSIDVIGADTRR